MADRQTIRSFVASRRAVLEGAQAAGTLARTKLDVKDEANTTLFHAASPEVQAKLREVLDEEVEAFCADMRMASVTVQQQVERRSRRTGVAILSAVCVFVVGIVILAALQIPSATIGFGVPFVAAVITFFVVW